MKSLFCCKSTFLVHVEPDTCDSFLQSIHCQECVPENIDLKHKVFMDLDKLTTSDMILASSTSCIVPSSFTSELDHRSQCIVAHPVSFTTFQLITYCVGTNKVYVTLDVICECSLYLVVFML